MSDAIWSYATPARDPVTGAFGFFFPRAGLRDLAAAAQPPGLLPDARRRLDRLRLTLPIVPLVLGALVPVVAWRIAADLAEERALSLERARTLAVGAGLVAAVSLPLVLPSAHLDSTIRFGAAGARRLPPHGPPAAPSAGPARWTRGSSAWASRSASPALARNEAAWVGLDVGARRADAALRGRAPRMSCGSSASRASSRSPSWRRGSSGTGSSSARRCPARRSRTPGLITGFEIFAWQDPADGGRVPGRWARPCGWSTASTGFPHNLLNVLLVPGRPSRSSA